MKPTLFVIVLALVWSALLGPVNAAPAATTKSTSSMRVLAACDPTQGQEKYGCYEESLLHVVRTSGVATAMDMLLVLGAFDEEVQREGHVYAHAIGINAFQSDPDVAKTFARCTELFQSGCYHGVIQAYLDQELGPSLADDSGRLNDLCQPYRKESAGRWLLFQCVHALGHGLMSVYAHDLPVPFKDAIGLSKIGIAIAVTAGPSWRMSSMPTHPIIRLLTRTIAPRLGRLTVRLPIFCH